MSTNVAVEGKVIQVIPWEKKGGYFSDFIWPTDGEYDMVYFALPDKKSIDHSKEKFRTDMKNTPNGERPASIFSLIYFLALDVYHRLGFGKKHSFNPFVPYTYIPVWIKRPHRFKEGDSISFNATIGLLV